MDLSQLLALVAVVLLALVMIPAVADLYHNRPARFRQ
jgi:hypothetical protein